MEYIEIKNFDLIKHIHNILKESGEAMFINEKLIHWKTPYSFDNIKNDILNKKVFLVKDKEEYIATFMLSDKKSPYFSDVKNMCYYLSKFAVSPYKSNKGIGTQIIRHIENYCKLNKISTIRLDVYDKSIKAVNFYLKNGFKVLFKASTKNFEVLCMEKVIK